jgi:pimeloyl-ACP methyl ester carboxylesterase
VPRAPVGDLSIAYDVHGSGDPVLMINGIGAPRGAWGLQVPFISERYQVITFDNRDVGETGPGSNTDNYGTDQFARDAAGLLDHLGIERAHVVGASMGGCIAQQFAVLFPERTQSVTIICSWATVEPWLDELWEQWEGLFRDRGPVEWSRTTWLWVFTHRAYREPGFLEGLLNGERANPNPQTLEMYLRQSHAARTHDMLDKLPSVTTPANVICGEEDIFTPPRYSVEIANAIPGARLTEMPEVGHGMFWEATDAFNALVRDFVDEHPITR